jgi:hypothetical protein
MWADSRGRRQALQSRSAVALSRAKENRAAKVAQASLLRERIEPEGRKLQLGQQYWSPRLLAGPRMDPEQASDVASSPLDSAEQTGAALESIVLARGAAR